jgi:hypothetical protein
MIEEAEAEDETDPEPDDGKCRDCCQPLRFCCCWVACCSICDAEIRMLTALEDPEAVDEVCEDCQRQ